MELFWGRIVSPRPDKLNPFSNLANAHEHSAVFAAECIQMPSSKVYQWIAVWRYDIPFVELNVVTYSNTIVTFSYKSSTNLHLEVIQKLIYNSNKLARKKSNFCKYLITEIQHA